MSNDLKYYLRLGAGMVLASIVIEAVAVVIFAVAGRVEVAPVIPAIILIAFAGVFGMVCIGEGGRVARPAAWARALWPVAVIAVASAAFIICDMWANATTIYVVAAALATGVVAAAGAVAACRNMDTLVPQDR